MSRFGVLSCDLVRPGVVHTDPPGEVRTDPPETSDPAESRRPEGAEALSLVRRNGTGGTRTLLLGVMALLDLKGGTTALPGENVAPVTNEPADACRDEAAEKGADIVVGEGVSPIIAGILADR